MVELEFTFKSTIKDQVETNFSLSRLITAELSRAVSLRVRPEPQHDWSSSEPHKRIKCTSLLDIIASLNASR